MDDNVTHRPAVLAALRRAAEPSGFTLSCEERTGALLATLAAARPGGRILEIGTGIGEGSAWLLSGMDADATLVTVELDDSLQAVARQAFTGEGRVEFVAGDAGSWLESYAGAPFDLVFADTWPGKFSHLDAALALVAPGGLYVIDDLLPQPGWPDGHQTAVDKLVADLTDRPGFRTVRMNWSSGLLLATKESGLR